MTQKKTLARKLPGAPTCGAKLRKREGVCRSKVLCPNRRCHLHGGPTPAGIASPRFKSGKYVRYWRFFKGLGLLELAEQAAAEDVDLKNSKDAMLLLQLRIYSLLEGKKVNDELDRAWLKLKEISRGSNPTATREAYHHFDTLMAKRKEVDWEEVSKLEEQLDRFRDRNFKRDVDEQRLIPVDKVLPIFGAMINAFKEGLLEVCHEAGRPDLATAAITKVANQYLRFVGQPPLDLLDEVIEVEADKEEESL
jgi:hypothetical protein